MLKAFFIHIFVIIFTVSTVFAIEGFHPVKAHTGMVVCAETNASEIGLNVLKQGGNAIDASVAVAFALAVTYPNAGNLGGGGFMIYRDAKDQVYALDYRETAPQLASGNMYLNDSAKVIEGASTLGYLAAGVPGTVAGLWQAHQRFGKLDWKQLIEPAIRLAENGFILGGFQADALIEANEDFNKFSSSKKIFTRNGLSFKTGDKLIQTDLAQSLHRIAVKGASGFYSGVTAKLISQDMRKNGGFIREEDLKNYKAIWRKPITGSYRGYKTFSMPPPRAGGIALAGILNTLELFDLSRFSVNSSSYIRLWVEIERQVYADRAQWLGDPDFIEIPVEKLISKEYAQTIKDKLSYFNAGDSYGYKIPGINFEESDQTTHFSIVDHWGNAVSNTFTLNGNYGSRVVAAGTGILLNNEMDDFSLKPGYPNKYGLIGSEANAILPKKRMLSSMTPTIITKNDTLFMIIGGPGGSKIITTVAQVISNVIDHKMNIRQAIETPRFHHQWIPDVIYLEEGRFNCDTRDILKNKGYKLEFKTYMGYAQGILFNSKSNEYSGWSDPRSDGQVKGY